MYELYSDNVYCNVLPGADYVCPHHVYECLKVFSVSNVFLSSNVEYFALHFKLLIKFDLLLIFCMSYIILTFV